MSELAIREDKTFYAGPRRVLWRVQVLSDKDGRLLVRLSRVGLRRVSGMIFPLNELPDVRNALAKLKITWEGG